MHRSRAEFCELRTYLSSKLQWNPELDDRKLIDEFLQGFYGPGASAVAAYIRIAHQASSREFQGMQPLTVDELLDSRNLLIAALNQIPPESPYYKRVKKVNFSVSCALAAKRELNWSIRTPQALAYKERIHPDELLKEIETDARLLQITHGSEHGLWSIKLKELGANLIMPVSSGTRPEIGRPLQDGWLEWISSEMRLASKAVLVDDPKATAGKAVMFDQTSSDWVISISLPKFSGIEPVEKEIWIAARCEPADLKSNIIAFSAGIHNSSSNTYQTRPNAIPYSVETCKGDDYKWLKVGTAELLNDTIQFFVSTKPDNSGKKVYIDRVIAVDPVK
jgi:hypothetical protein